jgi:hypothetical protein
MFAETFCEILDLEIILDFKQKIFTLKGQSHEKVGEMRVQGDSLGPN